MRARSIASGLALACAITSGACSFLDLGDLELVQCDPDPSVCDELNETLPEGQCYRYTCHESGRGCVLRPQEQLGLAEDCDGLDNDCDGFIDEGTTPTSADRTLPMVHGVHQVGHSAASEGALHLTLTRPRSDTPDLFMTTSFAVDDADVDGPHSAFAAQSCTSSPGLNPCNISQLAIAATPDVLVGVGVHSSGCGAGQLRIGVGAPADFDLVLGEGEHGGLGVDIHGDMACTRTFGCDGASAPAVAVLEPSADSSNAEALVVWLAPTEVGTPLECSEAAGMRLAALGLMIASSGDPVRAAPLGQSEQLGDAAPTGGPAIAASGGQGGYFVAFPVGDQIELLFIPRLAGAADRIRSDSWQRNLEAHGPVSELAISVGENARGLAIAYRVELETGVAIQLAALELRRDDEPHLMRVGGAVTLTTEGEIVAGPSLSYAPLGFANPEATPSTGGWLVVWAERSAAGERHLMAARIAEAELRTLGDPFVLASGAVTEPFTYLKHGSRLDCGYLLDDSVHLTTTTCEPDN